MALSDHQSAIEALVRDAADAIADDDRDGALQAAVAYYSSDRPRGLVADVTMAAQRLPLPAAWDDGTSRLRSVEFPVGETPPAYLPVGEFGLYDDGGTASLVVLAPLRWNSRYPENDGDQVRIGYTAAHVVSSDEDTVPPGDREAVAAWAAALLLDELAARATATRTPTIGADSVDHVARGPDYRAIAKAHRDRYYILVARGDTGRKLRAAGTVVRPGGDRARWYDLWPRWGGR